MDKTYIATINEEFKEEIISAISSYDNVLWWHRNIDRTGFYIISIKSQIPKHPIGTTWMPSLRV